MRGLICLVLIGSSVLAAAGLACSSPESGSVADDAGTEVVDVSLPDVDPPGVCAPVAPDRPSRNVPPRPRDPSACTRAQVREYAQSCIVDLEKPSECDAYAKENPTCFACIHSTEDSPDFGPILMFRDRQYFDLNSPGCIAHQLGDYSDTGCGATEGRFQDCARRACRGCSSDKTQDARDSLFACLDAEDLDNVCASEFAATAAACKGLKTKPPAPESMCLWDGNDAESFAEAILRYLDMWCSTVADAGTADAGDAGDANDGAMADVDSGDQ